MSTTEIRSGAASGAVSRERALAGQTVVVLGGTAGIGLEAARHARAGRAEVIVI